MTRLVRFSNNAVSKLASAITASSTTITLQAGDGSKFPTLTGTQFFMSTLIKSDGTIEVVKVTARTGDTLTVVRAAEAVAGVQTSYSFAINDRIEHRLTAKAVSDELDRLDQAALINPLNKSANYTLTAADVTSLVRVNTSGGDVTITLPDINTLADDYDCIVAKVTGDKNVVTVARSGSDTINGATSYTLASQWQGAWLTADRSTNTWTVIASGGSSVRAFVDTFTGTGTAGPFTLSGDPGVKENTAVYVGGVYQQKSTYTLTGTSLTLGGNVPAGVSVEVVWSQPLQIGTTSANLTTYMPAGAGATQTNVQDALRALESTLIFGGAVRNNSGTWSMIADSGHAPIGISSVSQPDAYTYKINYSVPGSKVGTVLSITDAELAPYGPHTGASGATDSATFGMWAPCVLYVNGRGSVSASPLWTTQTGPITTPDAASVLITHANRALAVDPPMVTPIAPAAGSLTRQYQVGWTATTTTITSLDDIQGLATSNGTTFTLSDCPNLNVSIAWSAGALTITHPDATGHNNVQLTALNSTLKPEVASVTATNIVVQFRDTAGAVVGPAQTNQMKVYFRRSALVPSTMDAGVRFGVDLGLCRVANADVGNISLNNFWIVGLNNK